MAAGLWLSLTRCLLLSRAAQVEGARPRRPPREGPPQGQARGPLIAPRNCDDSIGCLVQQQHAVCRRRHSLRSYDGAPLLLLLLCNSCRSRDRDKERKSRDRSRERDRDRGGDRCGIPARRTRGFLRMRVQSSGVFAFAARRDLTVLCVWPPPRFAGIATPAGRPGRSSPGRFRCRCRRCRRGRLLLGGTGMWGTLRRTAGLTGATARGTPRAAPSFCGVQQQRQRRRVGGVAGGGAPPAGARRAPDRLAR